MLEKPIGRSFVGGMRDNILRRHAAGIYSIACDTEASEHYELRRIWWDDVRCYLSGWLRASP